MDADAVREGKADTGRGFDFFEELERESSPAFRSTHSASLNISTGSEKAYHLGRSVSVFLLLSSSSFDSGSRPDSASESSSEHSSSVGGSVLSSTAGRTPHTAMNQLHRLCDARSEREGGVHGDLDLALWLLVLAPSSCSPTSILEVRYSREASLSPRPGVRAQYTLPSESRPSGMMRWAQEDKASVKAVWGVSVCVGMSFKSFAPFSVSWTLAPSCSSFSLTLMVVDYSL